MTKALMFDLETLGRQADTTIVSIGAVIFDPYGAEFRLLEQFYTTIKINQGREISPETLWFWMQQADRNIFDPAKARYLSDALEAFHDFCVTHAPEEIWCKGSDFDLAIIRHAFAQECVTVPWHYRAPMDLRTLGKLYPSIPCPGNPKKHNALEDASVQARWCWELMQYRLGREQKA